MNRKRWWALAMLVGTALGQNGASLPSPLQAKKPPEPRTENPTKINPEVQAIADGALALAPEFGADILARLSESSKVPSRTMKADLLEKAFYLAAQVETPVSPGASAFTSDTRSGYLAIAFRLLKLDRLSLQSRIVSDMLTLDAGKARVLFEQVKFPTLSPVGCEEPLTYNVSLFYQTAAQLARDGFSTQDKLKGLHVELLEPYVGALQSHTQVRPAAQLLLNADLSPAELAQLANMFAIALAELRGDERSFATANADPEFSGSGAIAKVMAALDAKGVSSIALLSALREYLVSNFGTLRCGETFDDGTSNSLPEAVASFNQQFRGRLQNAEIAPISEKDLKDARMGPKATIIPFWQSPEAKRLFTDERSLSLGERRHQLTASEKTTPEWSSKLGDFLNELEAWSPNGESPVDFFAEKSILYRGLITAIPNGPERSKIIDSFVEFLGQNSEQTRTRVEWLLMVNRLLSGADATDDRNEVMQAFLNSGDSALSVYARLELLDPRQLPKQK